MNDYSTGCSDCAYRTENVKIDEDGYLKDEFHPLLPYCDLKMAFIRKNSRQLTKDEPCIDSLECADWTCPVCGETCDLVIGKHKQTYFACKIHGELATPDTLAKSPVPNKKSNDV
jgi:C4-type Zn-finger protein